MKKIVLLIAGVFFLGLVQGQELQAKLSVLSNRVSTQVDKKIFQTLQETLTSFLNNRKWTGETYQPQEKIKCNFLINIDQDLGQNVFKATLTVQAARPVYGTSYESPLINYQDNDMVFRYIEFQPIEFNENRIQGNDPLAANLTAILVYYVQIILGLDHDSFSPKGGELYFRKAQQIVNNAPESRDITGWKPFDGMRNRFRLAENLTDNRFSQVHDAIYTYYRGGMDLLVENEETARSGILNALNFLSTVNKDNPNAMIMQVFFQGKSTELANVFKKANNDTRNRAKDLLVKLDVTNATTYKELK
ncbi:DUF4835 family protein [Flavisolibacter tropicus]|uniref:DUF4835 domain-containing protein n=1 Tax=Flavisolibacter tropicus TaxID=1492898 RepID=A0A172TUC8_9BACT|nr:DUF4835 family protein [Flavisolibacter tropicus]ANE50578.1 hypothetical protein SY85_08755 [Flavisolibacter tropicus]